MAPLLLVSLLIGCLLFPHGLVQEVQAEPSATEDAIAAGANYVVIGRPITSVWEPTGVEIGKRARQIASEILNS